MTPRDVLNCMFFMGLGVLLFFACGCGATPRQKVASFDRASLAGLSSINAAHDLRLISTADIKRTAPYADAVLVMHLDLRTQLEAYELGGGEPDILLVALSAAERALIALLMEAGADPVTTAPTGRPATRPASIVLTVAEILILLRSNDMPVTDADLAYLDRRIREEVVRLHAKAAGP